MDGDLLNHRAPVLHQELERVQHPVERPRDLLHHAQRDDTGDQRGPQGHQRHQHAHLQVRPLHHVEVQVVEEQPEVVAAHVGEQRGGGGRRGARVVVFAQHQFLAVGGFHALVVEFQPRQAHAHQGQQQGAAHGPEQRHPDQRMRHGADHRQPGQLVRQHPEHRHEGSQRHQAAQERQAQAFHGGGEAHGVFLHPLRRALDVAQPRPGGHVVLVHRLAPTEDVVLAEEVHHHRRSDVNHGDAREGGKLPPELPRRDAPGLAQRFLDQVVEAAEPVVDLHVQLDPVPGRQQDEDGAGDRPGPPPAAEKEGLEHGGARCRGSWASDAARTVNVPWRAGRFRPT